MQINTEKIIMFLGIHMCTVFLASPQVSERHIVMSNSLQPMKYNLPCSSVHGILQARILEWVTIPFSRGSFQPKVQTGIFELDSLLAELPWKPYKK